LHEWQIDPLEGFNGVIVIDEHQPYARLALEHGNIIARGGCWRYARSVNFHTNGAIPVSG